MSKKLILTDQDKLSKSQLRSEADVLVQYSMSKWAEPGEGCEYSESARFRVRRKVVVRTLNSLSATNMQTNVSRVLAIQIYSC